MLEVVNVDVNELKISKYNPRTWSKKATDDLKESIVRFGLAQPIICNSASNRKNVIIGGNFRFHVAKLLGYKEVPVVYLKIEDIEKEKELNLRLNANTGDWDFDILREFSPDLLLEVGFTSKDLKPIMADLGGVEDDNYDKSEEKMIDIKEGQIFQLGNHFLACGDSTNPELINKLVGDQRIDMIYSDPVFNISLDYDKGIGGKRGYGGKVDDNKPIAEYRKLIEETLRNGLAVSNEDTHIFYYCDQNYIWLIQSAFMGNGIKLKRVCLWIKNNQNPTSQSAFNKSYEPCVYGVRGKPHLTPVHNLSEIMNKEIGTGNDTITDLEDMNEIWAIKRLPSDQYSHPTEKPPTLHEKAIRRCTKLGGTVLDMFGGSGSTLIACEQLGRTCYMVEKDPTFCNLIINRYEALTSKKAKPVEVNHGI